MQVSVTFRHMDPSEALKSYVLERASKLTKYIDKPMDSQATLTVEKFRQKAELVINVNGIRIAGTRVSRRHVCSNRSAHGEDGASGQEVPRED